MTRNINIPFRSSISYRIALGTLALSLSGTLLANPLEFSPSLPYVGADVYQRNVTMVKGNGSESFPKRVPQGNLYIGTWFNDYFGIEGGWMFTAHNSRVAYNDSIELGVPLDPAPPGGANPEFKVAKNTLTIKGPHLGIVGQLSIGCDLRLLGSVGVSVLKITAISYPLADQDGKFDPDQSQRATKRFTSRRAIPAFGIGIMYPVCETLTIRLLARYEMTEKFKNMHGKFPNGTTSISSLSFKNNLLFGLGITHQF